MQQILEKVVDIHFIQSQGQEVHKRMLLDQCLLKDFVAMSMDKYGSNVTEKAVIFGGTDWRSRVWTDEISIAEQLNNNIIMI